MFPVHVRRKLPFVAFSPTKSYDSIPLCFKLRLSKIS